MKQRCACQPGNRRYESGQCCKFVILAKVAHRLGNCFEDSRAFGMELEVPINPRAAPPVSNPEAPPTRSIRPGPCGCVPSYATKAWTLLASDSVHMPVFPVTYWSSVSSLESTHSQEDVGVFQFLQGNGQSQRGWLMPAGT